MKLSFALTVMLAPTLTLAQDVVEYAFPPTETGEFVHGICAMGVSSASATSDFSRLTYTAVPNWTNGLLVWDDRQYRVSRIQGPEMCEGGLFLKPSLHKSIARGTNIAFEGIPNEGGEVSVCAFVEPRRGRSGRWDELLPADGFTPSDYFAWNNNDSEGFISYCKTLRSSDAPMNTPGLNGDPIIIGLQDQVFKFLGRDDAWYSFLSTDALQWNVKLSQFDSCPNGEDMFISAMGISNLEENLDIVLATTAEATPECREDPNKVCLGEGTLHISFDGGITFTSQPGDFHFGSRGRLVAHNTYAACSRKWHDYEVSANEPRNLRDFGRRATVEEKKPLNLLADTKMTMIDSEACGNWIDERVKNNDLFQQKGHWTTLHIETNLVSFHVEYRRSDWYDPKCEFQSLDAWMTKVDDSMEKMEWYGILGETKKKLYDNATGEQITSDRFKLLRGKDDSDYEVDGPFGKNFVAGAGWDVFEGVATA